MRPNWSPAPAKLVLSVSGSAPTPARVARRCEAVERGPGCRLVLPLLDLNHLGGDISRARHRNDRIEEKRNPGEMGAERRGNGDGIVVGWTGLFTYAQIDDDVLDHGGVSYGRRLITFNYNNLLHTRGGAGLSEIKPPPLRFIS